MYLVHCQQNLVLFTIFVNKTVFCLQYYGYGTDGTFGTVQMVQLVRCIGTRDTVQWYKGYVTRGAYGWYKGNCEYTICSTMCDRCVYSGHSYSGCRITGSPEYIDYCLLLFSLYIKTYRHMADLEKKSDVACFLYDILSSCAEIRCFFLSLVATEFILQQLPHRIEVQ